MNVASKRANKRTSEWPSTYVSSCLFQTTVRGLGDPLTDDAGGSDIDDGDDDFSGEESAGDQRSPTGASESLEDGDAVRVGTYNACSIY